MKTAPTDLIADHLYQVNLVLWMLQPSTGVPVNSLLYKAGYRLRDLEPVLPLPLELSNKLKDDGIAASDPVSPDVLAASAAKEFLLIECKRSMFGSQPQEGKGDSQIRQARSLLLQTPSVLADSIGLQHSDVRRSHLLYVSRDDPSAEQTLGLRELSDDLAAAGYRTCPFGMLGLRVAENTIVAFGAYSPGELPEAIPRLTSPGAARIHKLGDAQTDPRPLYLVPWMPGSDDSTDAYSKQAFGNRILLAAALIIGPAKPPCEIELDIEVLLGDATEGLYFRWRAKDVRKALRENAMGLLKRRLQRAASGLALQSLPSPSRGWRFSIPEAKRKVR